MKEVIISMCLGLLFLAGCKKEPEVRYVEQYLKDMIPYEQDQIVTFVSNQNDTFKAKVSINRGFEESAQCAGCEVHLKKEYFEYTITDLNSSLQYPEYMTLEILNRVENTVFLSVSPPHNAVHGYGYRLYTKDKLAEYDCASEKITCHDTITVNSILFSDVVEIDFPGWNSILYSKERGLIRFLEDDGDEYFVY